MFRCTLVFFAAAIALMACGDRAPDSSQTAAQSQPAEASHASPTDKAMPPQVAAAPPATLPTQAVPNAAPESAVAPESERCLDLVNERAFEEAVPICVRAAGLDPENTAVKQALETARKEAASAALGGSSAIPVAREDMVGGAALDGELP